MRQGAIQKRLIPVATTSDDSPPEKDHRQSSSEDFIAVEPDRVWRLLGREFWFQKKGDKMSSFLTTMPYHAHQAIGACVCYFALFLVLSPVLSAHLVPSLYSTLPRRTRINWNVRVVSLIQATFICTCSIHVILADDSRIKMDAMDRLRAYSPMAGRVQAFAAGYFLWDLLVSLRHLRILGLGSLVHALSALLVTITGFVSS